MIKSTRNITRELTIKKIRQLNYVINGLLKENQDREKEKLKINNDYKLKFNNVFVNYNVKMTKIIRSLSGQRKYFGDIILPEYHKELSQMDSEISKLHINIKNIFIDYSMRLAKLINQINDLSRFLFNLNMIEDQSFEFIYRSLIAQIHKMNANHKKKIKEIQNQNQKVTQNEAEKKKLKDDQEKKSTSSKPRFSSLNLTIINNVKLKLAFLKQSLSIIKKDFLKLESQYSNQVKEWRTQLYSIVHSCKKICAIRNHQKTKIKSRISDFETVYQSISTEPARQKIRHDSYVENLQQTKIKTHLSAGSLMECKFLLNNELKDMQFSQYEAKRENQREIFELQLKFRDEKNAILQSYTNLVCLIKSFLDKDKLKGELDLKYEEAKKQKEQELNDLQQKLDEEYSQALKNIEQKNKTELSKVNHNLFRSVLEKYEKEFHELQDELATLPQGIEDKRALLRGELIYRWKKEIDFENQRHSLQMLLFEVIKSSKTLLTTAVSNSATTIQQLKLAILRQMDINENSKRNFKCSPEEFFASTKERQIKNYNNKIFQLTEQKRKIEQEIQENNKAFNESLKVLNKKYYNFCDLNKQMIISQEEKREEEINLINEQYDCIIAQLKNSIDIMKKRKAPDTGTEAKIGKLNWHCELLNSQLAALTRQLRNAQRHPNSKADSSIRVHKSSTSSLKVLSPIKNQL